MGLKRRRQIEFGLTMVARVGGRAELKWWKLLYLYLYFFQYVFFWTKGICWEDTMEVLTIMTRTLRYAYFDVDCDWFV